MLRHILIFLALLMFLSFKPAFAQVNQERPAMLPMILSGNNVVVNYPVNQDLIISGGRVSIESVVNGNVYVTGGQVDIRGTVAKDLIAAGGTINVSGTVNGNVIAAGGQINLDSSSIVNGYLMAFSSNVNLAGKVTGSVQIGAGTVNLQDTSVIGGDLVVYTSNIDVSPQTQITGERKINIIKPAERPETPSLQDIYDRIITPLRIISFLGNLLVLFILIRLLENILNRIIDPLIESPLSAIGWGFIYLIVVPVLIFLLMITVIGIPLAVLTSLVYGLSIYFSGLIVSIAIGRWLQYRGFLRSNIYLNSFVGYLILTIIALIPYINIFTGLVVLLSGLGTVFIWQRSLLVRPR